MRRWAIIAAVTLAAWPASAGSLTGTASVIDGDIMEVGNVTVRINGIDAAELGQKCDLFNGGNWACDDAAADRLAGLAGGKAVECEAHGNDPYGRIIATCFVDGVDLGRRLVEEGLAWAFVKYDAVYRDQEEAAKAAELGIWRGAPEAPWDYRADRWERAAEASPRAGCPIKGNINGDGERIYHTPWSPWYSRTKINEAVGERWFCHEAEATAAGWRAAGFR